MKKILIVLEVLLFANLSIFSQSVDTNFATNVYQRPYSFTENVPQKGLLRNTGIFIGGSVGVMGLLYLMPENVTSWEKKNFTFENVFSKWWSNVKSGPVVDDDTWAMNYIAHPYWGGVFYMSARSLGYNGLNSFLYSAAMSTFLWEYGIESFAEIPSVQDLLVTPIIGSVVGELFYLTKRGIVNNDYCVLNSKFLGHFISFLVDPTNELFSWFSKEENTNLFLILQPNFIRLTLKL